MKILKQKDGTYKVESSSKWKFYDVDVKKGTCTCLHYKMRMAKIHGVCKHIQAAMDKAEKMTRGSYEMIISYVSDKGKVDSLELINKFSEEAVDDLISRGELIEEKGIIRVLS